jgi:thymidylate kinase
VGCKKKINVQRSYIHFLFRFWHSTGVYAIANEWRKSGREVPHSNDAIYSWPGDLLPPQLVIYLDVLEEIRLKRLSSRKAFTVEEDRLKANDAFRQK